MATIHQPHFLRECDCKVWPADQHHVAVVSMPQNMAMAVALMDANHRLLHAAQDVQARQAVVVVEETALSRKKQ